MLEVIAKLPGDGILLIEETVMSIMDSLKQDTPISNEAAGILIGEYRGNEHIRVVDATKPCRFDKSTRFSFERQSSHHQRSVLSAWCLSEGMQTWVGEWHTHPEDHPKPSLVDINQWRKSLPNRPMILLIQGRKTIWLGVSIKSKITCISD